MELDQVRKLIHDTITPPPMYDSGPSAQTPEVQYARWVKWSGEKAFADRLLQKITDRLRSK